MPAKKHMKKSAKRKVKPVRVWAVVNANGNLARSPLYFECYNVYATRQDATLSLWNNGQRVLWNNGQRVVRVEIREIEK